jgi:hypothetical protein
LNVSRLAHQRNTFLSVLGTFLLLTGCTSLTTNSSGSGGSGGSGGGGTQTPTVTVSGPTQVRLGSTISFTATVVNLTDTGVTWQVGGITSGNSSVGTISATGVYTPPAGIPAINPVTVTAVSVASPSTSGSAQVSLLNPVPVVTSAAATLVSGTNYALNVVGTSFVEGAQIQVGGTSVTTTFVSSTDLQATITVPSGTTTLSVGVVNPNPGSAASNSATAAVALASVTAAARLLDQATFGPTLTDIQNVQNVGIDAYITSQFNTSYTPLRISQLRCPRCA